MSYDLSDLLWTYELDTTALSDGTHTLTTLALDQVGHPASTSTSLFTDNTPPQVTVESPHSGLTVALTLSVTVQASDVSGISKIEYYLQAVGIDVKYGEPIQRAEDKGTFTTVGDREHSEIIRLRIEEGLGMAKIGERLERSSATPVSHIRKHNRAVERSGFCPACRRVKSPYEKEIAHRGG